MNYKKLTPAQANQLNSLLYEALVTDDGGKTFKFPFRPGTLNYIDEQRNARAYVVDDRILSVASGTPAVATLISNPVTQAVAIANGWLPAEIATVSAAVAVSAGGVQLG